MTCSPEEVKARQEAFQAAQPKPKGWEKVKLRVLTWLKGD